MALRAVAQWEWLAQEKGQLSVRPGDSVVLIDADSGGEWWLVRRGDGEAGFVPSAWLAITDESTAADESDATEALPAADPDVMREYLSMLQSGDDFEIEELQGVCEEEGVEFSVADSAADLSKKLQDYLLAKLASIGRNEYHDLIEHMDVDDAREVCEEEGLDAPEAAGIGELRAILKAHFCEPVADLEPESEPEPALDLEPEPELEPEHTVGTCIQSGAAEDVCETGIPSPRSAARRDAAWHAATQARKDRRVAMEHAHQPFRSVEPREIVWEEDPIERMKARRAEFLLSKRARLGDSNGEAPLPPANPGSPATVGRTVGNDAHEMPEDAERMRRLRTERERLVAEIEQLEDRIDELLSSSSDGSGSEDNSDSSDDSEGTVRALDELDADLRRAQAHRSLIEQKLRSLQLEAKHAAKVRVAARRNAAIDARSKDLLERVRAGIAAGAEGENVLPRAGSAARSLRRQM